jgi:curved DNA-binding protein CbpA
VLGLSLVFTQTQLKEAYRAKVRRWHPDSLQHQADADAMQAHKQMVQINAAYTYLSALQETK